MGFIWVVHSINDQKSMKCWSWDKPLHHGIYVRYKYIKKNIFCSDPMTLNFSSTGECLHFTGATTDSTTVSHANKDVGCTQTTHGHNYFCRNQPGNLIKKRLQNLKKPIWNGADLCIYPRFDIVPPKPVHQSIFIKPWANKAQSSDDCVIQECVMALQVHCTEPSFSIVLSAKINIGDEY